MDNILSDQSFIAKFFILLDLHENNFITQNYIFDRLKALAQLNQLTYHDLTNLQNAVKSHFKTENEEIKFEQFKTIIPCKDDFFVSRIFQLFDCDKNGSISIREFCETIIEFYSGGERSKLEFLFYIYDVKQEGKLYKENFHQVLTACVKESGLELDQEKISCLADVLFEDGVSHNNNKDFMSLEDFISQLRRQQGLIRSLNMIIDNLITPQDPRSKQSKKVNKRYLSTEYWSHNKTFIISIFALILLMLVITSERVFYFRNMTSLSSSSPNFYYIFSRAAGRNILVLSLVVIILVLRKSITMLRNKGLGNILPLDNNIYLHKVVGVLIFVLSSLHSLCHFINCAVNIQPDPVSYLQLTFRYWEEDLGLGERGLNLSDVYTSNCQIVSHGNCTRPAHFQPEFGYNGDWLCEVCPPGQRWSYSDWIFTMRPGLFGLFGGLANPTGIFLFVIIFIMFSCSLPCVRRRGHFEIFYFSHYLYVLYYLLLILHAPQFWKYFLPVGLIWLGETVLRLVHSSLGRGKTFVIRGERLPSRVTHLVINRPSNFHFNPGDWVFIKIPR